MTKRDNSYAAWQAEKDDMEAWCALVDTALPAFQRTLPRDPVEAAFLRSIGTSEALIGPERHPDCETAAPGFWQRMGRRMPLRSS
jgi:hypothetical protein